jgi:hypothetical protein
MPRDTHDPSADALFERLYDALSEGEVSSVEPLRKMLAESGLDVDRIVTAGKRQFADFLAQQRVAHARTRLDLVRKALESARASAVESIDAIRDKLAQALSGVSTGEAYVAYHRKLQSLEEEDVESLGDDSALLDFLARIDTEDPSR